MNALRRGDHVRLTDNPSCEGWVDPSVEGELPDRVGVAWADGTWSHVRKFRLEVRKHWSDGWKRVVA